MLGRRAASNPGRMCAGRFVVRSPRPGQGCLSLPDRICRLAELWRNAAACNRQVQATICFLDHPDLSEGNVGTTYGSGDEFLQQLLERQLLRSVEEHLKRIVRIEAAIARWFHAAKAARGGRFVHPKQCDCSNYSIFRTASHQNRVLCKYLTSWIIRRMHPCWHGTC